MKTVLDGIYNKRNGFLLVALICGVALGAFSVVLFHALHGSEIRAFSATYPREISRITFIAAGDVIPHQPVVQSAALAKLQTSSNPPTTAL